MVKRFFENSKALFYSKQTNILSAAVIIMVMVGASRILGLLRYRTFVHFFPPARLDTFLAAFQLSDLIFEILIMGAMSSAFVPVFSSFLARDKNRDAWYIAAATLNLLLLGYVIFAVLIFIFAQPIYLLVAQGYSSQQIAEIASYTRMFLLAQMFFVASYLFTAILESNQRFLASATAPLFYNIGIIITTIILAPEVGLLAPVIGVVVGASLHFLIQLPAVLQLGFKPIFVLDVKNPGVRQIARLALPRVIELSFYQIKRFADLFLASFVVGGLTYFRFGDSLSSLPAGLFGLSIAKAALPKLSGQAAQDINEYKKTFSSSFKEILFLVVPASVFIAILRLPLVRLAFGADQFSWTDTNQTGFVVSAFALGIFAYSLSLLVSRAFYALQDTATPVKISIMTIFFNAAGGVLLILGLKTPIWGLAMAYSLSQIFQLGVLLAILTRRVGGLGQFGLVMTTIKIFVSSLTAGGVMFLLLKVLDRSAWDKKLSFLGHLGLGLPKPFDTFLLDTRYTLNLIYITVAVALIGALVYLLMSALLRIEELRVMLRVFSRLPLNRVMVWARLAPSKTETISTPPNNGV